MKVNKIKHIKEGEETITPWEQDENMNDPSLRSSRRQFKTEKTFLKTRNYSQPIRQEQRQVLPKKTKIQKIGSSKKVEKMQQEKQGFAKTLNITFNILQDPSSSRCPQKMRKNIEGMVSEMSSRTPSRHTTFRVHGQLGQTFRSQPKNVFERNSSGFQNARTPIKRETIIRSYANFFHSAFQRSKSKDKIHTQRVAEMLKVIRNNLRKDGELGKKIKKAERGLFRQHVISQRGRQQYQS